MPVKSKSSQKSVKPMPSIQSLWQHIAVFFGILLVVGGGIFMVWFQSTLKESQDLRQQASVADGLVTVTLKQDVPTDTDPTIVVNEPTNLVFTINTHDIQTDGIQLVYNIVTDTMGDVPEVVLVNGMGLNLVSQEIEPTADGYLVSSIILPSDFATPFSSNYEVPFLRINFTPTSTGPITFNFDVENSISPVSNTNPVEDELKSIATVNFQVEDVAPSPSPSASPIACTQDAKICPDGSGVGRDPDNNCEFFACPGETSSPSPSPSASPSPSVSPSPSASPSVSPSPSPSATPEATPEVTPTPGVGGTTVKSCNESCSENSECGANQRCYENRCRLATNVSSNTCDTAPDQGLSYSCNQYCANTGECASGYTCFYNRCRHPQNVESTSCSTPTTAMLQIQANSCNQTCSSNNDCAANLLCNQGTKTCRLASNPSSTSCSPASAGTVSNSIYTTKGGVSSGSTGIDQDNGSGTAGEGILGLLSPRPIASNPPGSSDDETMAKDDLDQSAFGKLLTRVVNKLATYGISFPLLLIGGGVALLLLVLLWSLFKPRKNEPPQPPQTPGSGSGGSYGGGNTGYGSSSTKASPPATNPISPTNGQDASAPYEQKLSQKIQSLQQNQAASPAGNPTTPPAIPTIPSNGMVERLNAKGVTPPASS